MFKYYCTNGVLRETGEVTLVYPEAVDGYMIGSDNRVDGSQMFKGIIYSVNLFDDVRTEEEIKTDAYAVTSDTAGLIYSKYFKN